MANLKIIKNRIKSVKSTEKITKAMKVVAAAKLRRAKTQLEEGRFYLDEVIRLFVQCLPALQESSGYGPHQGLYIPTGKPVKSELLILLSSDRGLCGPFNGTVIRAVKLHLAQAKAAGIAVTLLCVGAKAYEALAPHFPTQILQHFTGFAKAKAEYHEAETIAAAVFAEYHKTGQKTGQSAGFDRCFLLYNHFVSAINQRLEKRCLLPYDGAALDAPSSVGASHHAPAVGEPVFEPSPEKVAEMIAKRYVTAVIFQAFLHHSASEQGARMTAMDNATQAAGDMIKSLSLKYNRTRQANITRELIEIISGAEAV